MWTQTLGLGPAINQDANSVPVFTCNNIRPNNTSHTISGSFTWSSSNIIYHQVSAMPFHTLHQTNISPNEKELKGINHSTQKPEGECLNFPGHYIADLKVADLREVSRGDHVRWLNLSSFSNSEKLTPPPHIFISRYQFSAPTHLFPALNKLMKFCIVPLHPELLCNTPPKNHFQ